MLIEKRLFSITEPQRPPFQQTRPFIFYKGSKLSWKIYDMNILLSASLRLAEFAGLIHLLRLRGGVSPFDGKP
jgi:hypothetical protein